VDESGPDAMDDAVEELGNEPFPVGRAGSGAATQAQVDGLDATS